MLQRQVIRERHGILRASRTEAWLEGDESGDIALNIHPDDLFQRFVPTIGGKFALSYPATIVGKLSDSGSEFINIYGVAIGRGDWIETATFTEIVSIHFFGVLDGQAVIEGNVHLSSAKCSISTSSNEYIFESNEFYTMASTQIPSDGQDAWPNLNFHGSILGRLIDQDRISVDGIMLRFDSMDFCRGPIAFEFLDNSNACGSTTHHNIQTFFVRTLSQPRNG